MKNRILYLLTFCMSVCLSMFGQTDSTKVIRQLDASADHYIPLLTRSGYEAFCYDITSLLDGQYYLSVKIKEYKDGNEICEDLLQGYYTLPNMRLLSDFPEESLKEIKPEDIDDPERGIFKMAKQITIGLTPVINDTIRPIMIEVENMGGIDAQLYMKPQYEKNDSVNGKELYMYNTRPFKTGELTTGQFIPLVLFGSWWYDKDFGIHRFCGEKEINPDMSSRILKYLPHYYIIGIEVTPIKML